MNDNNDNKVNRKQSQKRVKGKDSNRIKNKSLHIFIPREKKRKWGEALELQLKLIVGL